MKVQSKFFLILTLISAILLPSCSPKNKGGIDSVMKAYRVAQAAQDYQSASTLLIQVAAMDSAANPWVYDSLAFYHYFYLVSPGVVRNPHTAKHYAQLGIDINPENTFLIEIKARLELEEQKVAVAQSTFQSLWNKTKDDTYMWILAFIEAHNKKNLSLADSMITAVLSNPESDKKTVRIDLIAERVREKVASKAAFLYLKATLQIVQNRMGEASQTLQEALKVQPDFYSVKLAMYELQQQSAKRQQ